MLAAELFEKAITAPGRGSKLAMATLFTGGIAAGVIGSFTNPHSYTRRTAIPTVMGNLTGDPQYIGKVMQQEFNKAIMAPEGNPYINNTRAGFNPTGNVVLGLYNLRSGG